MFHVESPLLTICFCSRGWPDIEFEVKINLFIAIFNG